MRPVTFVNLSLALVLWASIVQAETLKIGYVTDLSGYGAFFGVQSQRGAVLAQKELGANGRAVTLVFEDTRGETKDAPGAAIKLLEHEKVDALICDLTTVCSALAPIVKNAGKPLIYHSPAVSIQSNSPYAYRNFIDYVEACAAVARGWKKQGLEPVGTLAPNLEFGELCLAGVTSAAPNHFSYRYNPKDDLRSAVNHFRSRGVRAIMHVGYEGDFLSWFKLCREQRYVPQNGFVEIMLSDVFQKGALDALPRSTIVGYQQLPRDFVERLDKAAPSSERVNVQGAALAYNAVTSLARAFEKCPSREIGCIDNELRSPKSDLLLGFRGWVKGQPEYPVALKRWNNGLLEPAKDP